MVLEQLDIHEQEKPKQKTVPPKTWTDNLGFIKIRNFPSSKDPVMRLKRQTADLEKIFAIYIYNTGLLCRIYFKNKNKQSN